VDLFYEKVVNFDFLVTGTVEERPELLVGAWNGSKGISFLYIDNAHTGFGVRVIKTEIFL
jgi:hypothetical protein